MDASRVGWLVGVGILLLVVLFGGKAFAEPPATDAAAVAAIRGELASARALLLDRLKRDPRDARALFVLASVCLQEGDLKGARETARRFTSANPAAPEAPVLAALIEERARPQVGSWSSSFVAALRTARVQATPTIFPAGLSTRRAVAQASLQVLEPSERLLVEYALSESPEKGDLVAQALEISKRPAISVPVGVTAYSLLTARNTSSVDGVRAKAAAELIHALAKAHPDEPLLGLAAMLEGSARDTPISSEATAQLSDEVSALEANPHTPLTDLYKAFKQVLAKVDPASAHEVAFGASTVYVAALPTALLTARARATLATSTRSQRDELALALRRLGKRMAAGPCVLDLSLARVFLSSAAELSSDPALRDEATVAASTFSAALARAGIFKFLAQWPIAPLQRELNDRKAEGELALLNELTAAP